MTYKLSVIVLIASIIVSCGHSHNVEEVTKNFQSICEGTEAGQEISLRGVLQDTIGDKVYVFYPESRLPSSIWSNENEFLDYMKLTSNLDQSILTSDTLATILVIENDVIVNQYIVNCKKISIHPYWFNDLDCYLGGPVNKRFNSFDDPITCDTLKNEIIIKYSDYVQG